MTDSEPALIKISVIQARMKRFDKDYNVNRVLEMVNEELTVEKSHFICIPNYFFQTGLEMVPGKSTRALAELAVRHDAFIVGGLAEDIGEEKGVNSCFVIFPDGTIKSVQQKVHMISMEKKKLEGGKKIETLDTPLARIGCVICNDVFYPETARSLSLQGAEIIFIPSFIGGTGVRGLEAVARARAVENQVFVVNANGIPLEVSERHPELEMGGSGIYSPFLGNIDLARAGRGEEVIRAIIDLDELREVKKAKELDANNLEELAAGKSFNMLTSRRPDVYNI